MANVCDYDLSKYIKSITKTSSLPLYCYDVEGVIEHQVSIMQCLEGVFPSTSINLYLPIFVNPCFPLVERICRADNRIGLLCNTVPEVYAVRKYFNQKGPRLVFAGGILSRDSLVTVCKSCDLFYASSIQNFFDALSVVDRKADLGVRLDFFNGTSRGISPEQFKKYLKKEPLFRNNISSIHAYIGPSRASYSNLLALAKQLLEIAKLLPDSVEINFSGGWPYDYEQSSITSPTEDNELQCFLDDLKKLVSDQLDDLPKNRFSWELGKYSFAPFGFFVSKVNEVQNDSTFLVDVHVDASFTQLPAPKMKGRVHKVFAYKPDGTKKHGSEAFCRLWGTTGLSTDTLMPDPVLLPMPEKGDVLVIGDVGAYGRAGSYNFLGMQRPAEAIIEDNKVILVRDKQKIGHLLDDLIQK